MVALCMKLSQIMNLSTDKQSEKKQLGTVSPDEQAFKIIYDQYWLALFQYAFNVLNDKTVCEDIVQQVFVSLWQKNENLEIENLSAYLFRAVKFQILKHLRNGKITQQHLDQITFLASYNDIEEKLVAKDLESQLKKLIGQLPERCRHIFTLSRFEHRTNQEIAQHLGLSIQTVKNQISKAINYIRQEMPNNFLVALLLFLCF